MIIKNEFFNSEEDLLYKEKEGLDKAIKKWDDRFQKGEVEREKFLKKNIDFAKKQKEIKEKIQKLNHKSR